MGIVNLGYPSIFFCVLYALPMATAFNMETVAWRRMSMPTSSFGYRVTQEDVSSLLVSAPLEQYEEDMRGRVYKCQLPAGTCSPLNINVPSFAVNMSLGLTMTRSDIGRKTVVCGPTIPKECDRITLYSGMCFGLSNSGRPEGPVPSTLEECKATDIAFLLDGSGSVNSDDFVAMKEFVIDLMRKLLKKNTRFAISQYSSSCKIHVNFNQFRSTGMWEFQVKSIRQLEGGTNTAGAISKLVNELFVPSGGVRPQANKILIVITDGESQDGIMLPSAIARANAKNIIRYAVGVGEAFRRRSAREELNKIASSATEHVFKVDSFAALEKISSTLEKNIIAIEGTQTTGDATQMEFAQSGFSAAYVSTPASNYFLGTVGAYGWTGGFLQKSAGFLNPNFVKVDPMLPDSYLGYSMDVAWRDKRNYIILGAPRYEHKGLVMVVNGDNSNIKQTLKQSPGQIGSYFGAEVRAVDTDGDDISDLILVSAPMHMEDEQEGKVFVYQFKTEYFYSVVSDTGVSLLGMEGQRGRFGSSLASLADLNGDGIRDVAVGAPLEDNGQGSVYIFNGRRRGVKPNYSQRIAGSSVRSGLRFFGLTVAQSALDQSGDGLPDIAVGSKGAVLLLRSRPIVSIVTSVTFNPPKIPTSISDCTDSQQNKVSVCFTMTKSTRDSLAGLQAKLNYTLSLDFVRQKFRAFFKGKERQENKEVTVSLKENCFEHSFLVQCSPEDVVNPVDVQVTFSFQGLPIQSAEELRPKLASSSSNTSDHKLNFEIDCGEDKVCTDNIHLNFNFSGASTIEVGITQEMSVTVMVENRGENSYNTRVSLSYPHGLSYRTFTKTQGRVECSSLDSPDESTQGKTHCSINRPILMAGDKAIFVVQYGIDGNSQFDERVTIQAQASSDNDKHDPENQLSKTLDIGVKYSIYVVLKRSEGTTNYINFTAGNNHLQKPVVQNVEVTNGLRGLNLTVIIQVPVKLQGKDIWTDVDSLHIQGCTRGGEKSPIITDLQHTFKDNKEPDVNCSIAVCLEFRCNSFMIRDDKSRYNVSGNVRSGWIEQTGLRSASFHLVTSATLEYDNNKYIFYSSDSSRHAPVARIETLVEVYEEPNLTKEIIGGVVAGLILLALMTAGLAKSGFFKSQYQQKLEDAGAQGGEEPLGAEAE